MNNISETTWREQVILDRIRYKTSPNRNIPQDSQSTSSWWDIELRTSEGVDYISERNILKKNEHGFERMTEP